MDNLELVQKAIDVAQNYKTLYIMGCFGAPMGYGNNRTRYMNNNDYNRQPIRQKMIKNASADTFGFDCVCFIKGLLWGWKGDKDAIYGGATYASNGVPDIGTEGLIQVCHDVSSDMKNITKGEVMWMSGHVGLYIGDGKVVECTPAWKNGVQITNLAQRNWLKHGKMPYIVYKSDPTPTPVPPAYNPYEVLPLLRYGSTGDLVKLLQIQLKIDPDGIFGYQTETAVKEFQILKKLEVDGIVGKCTYNALFGE